MFPVVAPSVTATGAPSWAGSQKPGLQNTPGKTIGGYTLPPA